jgi:hypothetical protein
MHSVCQNSYVREELFVACQVCCGLAIQ